VLPTPKAEQATNAQQAQRMQFYKDTLGAAKTAAAAATRRLRIRAAQVDALRTALQTLLQEQVRETKRLRAMPIRSFIRKLFVLPAWGGSKTALAGSKSCFSRKKIGV
jgi:hypothetical protein